MKEKLIIKNFGPIKDVELDLGRFNVLIGENATGKSTVAKVLAVCRYFSYIRESRGVLDYPFELGLESWGLNGHIQDNKSYFSYENIDYHFTAQHFVEDDFDGQTGEIDGEISRFKTTLKSKSSRFSNLLNELNRITPPVQMEYGFVTLDSPILPASFFQNDVGSVMNNPFYAPTQRGLQSIFSLGKSSIQNLSDALFNQLAKLDSIARFFKNETSIEPLDIVYKNVNGHGFIRKKNDDNFYSLFNAASGYQSTIPIVLLAKYYSEIKKKPKTFIIEEPELNLFPSAQNKLMQFLVDKTMNYGNSLLLTTHSPYILTAVNNLLYAFKIGLNHEEEINKIIDKKYWLDPDNVSAYMLLPNGKCVSILDKEGLIKTEKIDSVSGDLNKEFNEMFDIELAIEK